MPERDKPKQPDERWPFNPMQPGDHEPVRIPEESEAKEPEDPSAVPGAAPKRS